MMQKIIVILAVSLLFSSLPSHGQCSCQCDVERDSLALVDLHNALGNFQTISPWDLSEPMEEWIGVTLRPDRCVDRIQRNGVNLKGPVPASIGNLECLTVLRLADNELNGEIPETITQLSCLTWISLSINQLTGEIPPGIGNLEQLERLGLNINDLSGSLPEGIGNLTQLVSLALNDNDFQGCIPESFKAFCGIDLFNLGGNPKLPFRGDEEDFCQSETQIGADCFANGQPGVIDENCDCVMATAMENISKEPGITIFPNPFENEIKVASNDVFMQEVQIFDGNGITRLKKKVHQQAVTLDLSALTPGVYFLETLTSDGRVVRTISKHHHAP